jgi:signal transduction histidine kinase
MFRYLQSTSVRIALGYAALFILSALALVGFLWWQTTGYLDREIDAVIVADTRAVGDRLRDFGLAGAKETIDDRVRQTADGHALYLLTDPMRNPVAGNLEAWPPEVGTNSAWYDVPLLREGAPHATRILHVVLTSGFHLLVGRDVQDRVILRGLIVDSLGWTALAALIFAVAGGLLVRHTVLSRVATINQTANAIVHGDLSRRMTAPSTRDEFDQLARTINGMLDQIQLLIEGARNTSDAIAHDLRTPLTELRNRLESIVLERPQMNVTIEEVQKAVGDTDRLIAVFNALLRLADIKSGVRRAGFRKVDLADVVADIAELYAPLAEENAITLALDAPHGLTVNGDPHLLSQALANLIDNAIKFTPRGGAIQLQLNQAGRGRVEIRVTDNGTGIPDDEKQLVTEKFHRGKGQEDTPGSGLGLNLVEAIVRLHAGVFVLSDNDPGLVASLLLPSDVSELSMMPHVKRSASPA